jgi:hypothetical protein
LAANSHSALQGIGPANSLVIERLLTTQSIRTEKLGAKWDGLDLSWQWQAVAWLSTKFVGLTEAITSAHHQSSMAKILMKEPKLITRLQLEKYYFLIFLMSNSSQLAL